MANPSGGTAWYLERFGDSLISCSPYVLSKLGVDRAHCFLKIESYVILCVPFQLGFRRSVFMASLSAQELGFFGKYTNAMAGLSLTLNPGGRPTPVKFFILSTLRTIGQMKGRDNVGLFVLDFKSSPGEMVSIMGDFLETQERIKTQYDDYGKTGIRMSPETARAMGYNLYATIGGQNPDTRRIQVHTISSKEVVHLEAPGAPPRPAGPELRLFISFFSKSTGCLLGEPSPKRPSCPRA